MTLRGKAPSPPAHFDIGGSGGLDPQEDPFGLEGNQEPLT